jgi:activator of 2-hydroxyglutaryl-CoA dehydratase
MKHNNLYVRYKQPYVRRIGGKKINDIREGRWLSVAIRCGKLEADVVCDVCDTCYKFDQELIKRIMNISNEIKLHCGFHNQHSFTDATAWKWIPILAKDKNGNIYVPSRLKVNRKMLGAHLQKERSRQMTIFDVIRETHHHSYADRETHHHSHAESKKDVAHNLIISQQDTKVKTSGILPRWDLLEVY